MGPIKSYFFGAPCVSKPVSLGGEENRNKNPINVASHQAQLDRIESRSPSYSSVTGRCLVEGLEISPMRRKTIDHYEFELKTCTDPVNDEPGLMIEIYLKKVGQVAEVYCENGVIKVDVCIPSAGHPRLSEWPEIRRQLESAIESGQLTMQEWIEQDKREGRWTSDVP